MLYCILTGIQLQNIINYNLDSVLFKMPLPVRNCLMNCSPCFVQCDQYWPIRGTETYGVMQVTLSDVQEVATYCIRTLHITRVRREHTFLLHLIITLITWC